MDKTRTVVSMWSQSNVKSKLYILGVTEPSDFEGMAREPSILGHEIRYMHAFESHLSSYIFFIYKEMFRLVVLPCFDLGLTVPIQENFREQDAHVLVE